MYFLKLQEHLKMERELRGFRRGDMVRVLGDLMIRACSAFGCLPAHERYWRIRVGFDGAPSSEPAPDLATAITLDDKGNGAVGVSLEIDPELADEPELAAIVRMRVIGNGAIAMTIDGEPAYGLDAAPNVETFVPVLFEALRRRITNFVDSEP
jgi:hypothetical protein